MFVALASRSTIVVLNLVQVIPVPENIPAPLFAPVQVPSTLKEVPDTVTALLSKS